MSQYVDANENWIIHENDTVRWVELGFVGAALAPLYINMYAGGTKTSEFFFTAY